MARFAVSNSQDQSAASWIVAFLLLSYTTLTTLVRGFVKFSMLGLDDAVACLAQMIAYGNVFGVIYSLHHGLGKSSPDAESSGSASNYDNALHASIVLYLLALASAKATTVLFLRRVFRQSGHTYAMLMCKVAVAVMAGWGIGASVAVSVSCHVGRLWQSRSCDQYTTWLAVAVFDCTTEFALMILAVWLVSQLQMTVKKKVEVCTAFAWRLGLVVMAAVHYRAFRRISDSSDTDAAICRLIIWEQVSICYSLLTITWPFSKVFINSFDTAQLIPTGAYGSNTATSRSNTVNPKRRVNSMKPSSKLPWQNNAGHSITVYSRPADSRRDDVSFGSQEMIIRREDEVTVSYAQGRVSTADPVR